MILNNTVSFLHKGWFMTVHLQTQVVPQVILSQTTQEKLKYCMRQAAISAACLSTLGMFYYLKICQLDQGLGSSCGSAKNSLYVNLGLPFLAAVSACKVANCLSSLKEVKR